MTTDAQPRWELSDLVRSRLKALQRSYRTAEAMSADPQGREPGLLWKRSTLEALAKRQTVKAPTAAQLRALAGILEVPLRTVQDAAAAQFFDLDTLASEDGEVRLMVQGYTELSPEDRERLLAIVESWRVKGAVTRSSDKP